MQSARNLRNGNLDWLETEASQHTWHLETSLQLFQRTDCLFWPEARLKLQCADTPLTLQLQASVSHIHTTSLLAKLSRNTSVDMWDIQSSCLQAEVERATNSKNTVQSQSTNTGSQPKHWCPRLLAAATSRLSHCRCNPQEAREID